jgi:NAD(P)-dependent dehydrogenase (short-subunit alcohol dehydrogenase family)
LENLGIPKEVLLTEDLNTTYDCTNTLNALEGSNISVPRLNTYAGRLWNYWEQHLNPQYLKPQYLQDVVKGKTVLITGGSEGIGREVAENCAKAGAKVIVVARTKSKLDAAVEEMCSAGGDVVGYSCDLTDLDACDNMIDDVIKDHDFVDILINNAGRSIRRSLSLTYDRFHDFERVMQINYFSAIRLSMKLLPLMAERKTGQIVNISSIAALSKGSPRFSSYMASKCALDAWAESANLEYASENIYFTNVHMPLVRTKMIEATKSYQDVNVLSPRQAGELVNVAMIHRPREVNTLTGNLGRQLAIFAPKLHKLIFSTLYQITDDSEAAKSTAIVDKQSPKDKATRAMDALQHIDLDKETLAAIANVLQGYHT